MLGIVGEGEGIASEILTDLGVELVELCQKVVELSQTRDPVVMQCTRRWRLRSEAVCTGSPASGASGTATPAVGSSRSSRGWTAPYLVRGDVSAGYLDRFPDHHSSSHARP